MMEKRELLNAIIRGIPRDFNFPFGPYIVLHNGIYDSYGDADHAIQKMDELDKEVIEVYWHTIDGRWIRVCDFYN